MRCFLRTRPEKFSMGNYRIEGKKAEVEIVVDEECVTNSKVREESFFVPRDFV